MEFLIMYFPLSWNILQFHSPINYFIIIPTYA